MGIGTSGKLQWARVDHASDSSALVELLAGISDRRIRRKVKKLVEFGSEAVRSLGDLDSALYSRANGEDQDQLQIISDAVLSHVRRLLNYLASILPAEGSEPSADEEIGIEFVSGDSLDLTNEVAAVRKKISGAASAACGAGHRASDEERWRELMTEMDSMQYGLGSEVKEYDRRFAEALTHDRNDQALRDLNDAVNSLLDGVFAMITTTYEVFLGHADPERMIPGYRDTLGKALAVRRSVTVLRREVQELNRSIQDPQSNPVVVEMSFNLLLGSLNAFIEAEGFPLFRPGDRKEFLKFGESLREGDAIKCRMDCEGLDKYLDSLAVVSQRDVLLKHDSELREQLFAELEGTISLADSDSERLPEFIGHCFRRADRLFGLMEELDSLVHMWSRLGEEKRNDPDEVLAMGRRLRDLIEPPKKSPPPPEDGDFF